MCNCILKYGAIIEQQDRELNNLRRTLANKETINEILFKMHNIYSYLRSAVINDKPISLSEVQNVYKYSKEEIQQSVCDLVKAGFISQNIYGQIFFTDSQLKEI